MEARIFSLFFVFDVISLYKHNMYRNSTQTNMFLFFFFISEYNFLMSFKQSARASHIRTQCKFYHSNQQLLFVCYVLLVLYTQSLGREVQACIRSSLCRCVVQRPLSCLCECVCVFEIYMLHVLHGIYMLIKADSFSSGIYTGKKMAAREVGGQRSERVKGWVEVEVGLGWGCPGHALVILLWWFITGV